MSTLKHVLLIPGFGLISGVAWAEDVQLPAPVLQWSFYILLLFALVVAYGIFFVRTKNNVTDEPLSVLIKDSDRLIYSVGPDTTVTECVRSMTEHKIGAMLVIADNQLTGIFTERDCLTRVVGAGLDPTSSKISEVMTPDPVCVSPDTSMDEAMSVLSNHRFRHLPVMSEGKVLGIVSSGDLTHKIVEDKSVMVRELVDVAGRRRASL
jgi:CBS domain-containing protein